jgi:transcription antitermination protein NusB
LAKAEGFQLKGEGRGVMASRRKARELALQMLFQWEMGKHTPEHVVQTFLKNRRLDDDVAKFARGLFEGAAAESTSIDELIASHSTNWRVERMAAVDRNILRLAVYELIHRPDTAPAIVIDEALEIARRYSGADSVEFVNGVLDAVRKSLAPAGTKP